MLARSNKGDLGADLDGDEHSSTSVDLFCIEHD